MALFTRTAKLDPGAHGARCARDMAVHHAVGISRQRYSGYRPSRVNIMAQGLSTPDPSLSPTHLSIMRGSATTTHYTHHQLSLMVSRNTTIVPSMGLRIGPACEAGLSAGMRRERVLPQRIKITIKIPLALARKCYSFSQTRSRPKFSQSSDRKKAIKTIYDGVNIGAFQQLFCRTRILIPCLKRMLFCQLIDRIDAICGTARNFGRKTIVIRQMSGLDCCRLTDKMLRC